MNTKLEQYRIFNEAATTLSFSKAAHHLYISQSAVSQAINSLEKELDVKLFIRLSKGVILTPEGEMMHKNIAEALTLISSAENKLTSFKELKSGSLTIGAGDALCEHYLLNYIVHFRKLYPNISLKVVNGTSLETIKMVKNGTIDLAFVNMPLFDEALTIKPCLDVHDIFVTGHQDDHIYSYEEIASQELIMLERLSNSRHYIDHIFSTNGVLLKPAMELGAYALLVLFAKYNLGISCIIKEFSAQELERHEIYELKLAREIAPRQIGYAYLKRKSLSASAMEFIKLLTHPQMESDNQDDNDL
ncbi:MAG TPA: LysR family transcriptional regulator [Erysipelotrichaceae bacterium]|nr:LysR family transcriptional regulator [Erysipelotrichaceae bacterium]